MRPDIKAIQESLTRRAAIVALYLCGPFDERGEPASPDVHILALTRDQEIRDLHYLPGITGFQCRVEVSIIPYDLVLAALQHGVATWLMFYTLDKMNRGEPILESARLRKLRLGLARQVKVKPSFYSHIMKSAFSALRSLTDHGQGQVSRLLHANTMLILSLYLFSIGRAGRTFSRHSDLLEAVGSSVGPMVGDIGKDRVEMELASARLLLESVGAMLGIRSNLLSARNQECGPD